MKKVIHVELSKPMKLIYLAFGLVCLGFGLLGLIFPILPGVLFLLAALFLLSRGSARIARFAQSNSQIRKIQTRLDRMQAVSVPDQLRLAGWMVLETGVRSAQFMSRSVSRVRDRFR